jgi:aspartyl-tRNA(Asn)/glutamyl-tRNA(Gln) amidotransferase subunit B
MPYEPVIGMEVHAELKTKSKMFCDCENELGLEKEPNIHICPVCTAQPGALPVINKKAVEMVIKTGLSLNCKIADESFFERKNYFYPDLPKGYQTSQYQKPLCYEGFLDISGAKIGITRIHLEEDTGKLTHPKGADYSLVDFNRAGVPLMELVTEPDIRSGEQAKKFCQELQLIFRYLGVSDADMEKGQMRCEVNISLWEPASGVFGTKVEIKNLNSFKVVEKAIDYEIKRQGELLGKGEKIIQETRGWDDNKGETYSQRIKEEAHDYRYFPEPDLPPLKQLSIISEKLKSEMPELPQQKRLRFASEYSLPEADIEILVNSPELANYFEEVCSELIQTEYFSFCHSEGATRPLRQSDSEARRISPRSFADAQDDKKDEELRKLYKLSANYLITELPRIVNKLKAVDFQIKEKITAENFAEFAVMVYKNIVSSSGAQTVLEEMFKTGADPTHIIKSQDLAQVSDAGELDKIADEVINDNLQPVADYKAGKEASLQFLVGQMMKKSKGKANPQVAADILRRKLTNS